MSQSTQLSRKTRPVMGELQHGKWKWAKANLAPMWPRLGHRVLSTSHAVQTAALSHFSGALDAAAWQEPSPSATGRRGPSSWPLQGPTSPERAAGSSGCLHCCQEPAGSSLLLLGFPRTSALDGAAQPRWRALLVSQECQTGFRVKKRGYRYKLHPCVIASKRKLWHLCLVFLPESLCDTCLGGQWCKFNGITQLQVLLSIQMNCVPPYLDQIFLFLMSTNMASMSHIPTSVIFWNPCPGKIA